MGSRREESERIAKVDRAMWEAGVPDDVIDYALRHGLHPRLYYIAGIPLLALLLGGFLFIGLYLFPWLEETTGRNVRLRAEDAEAILYHYNSESSLLLAFLVWPIAIIAMAGLASGLSSRLMITSFSFAFLEKHPAFSRLIRWGVRRLESESDPARYVRRMMLGWVPAVTAAALVLAALGGWAVYRDLNSYSLYTSTAYFHSPFFPWNASEPRPWSFVAAVETGCNHVEDKRGVTDTIVYRIKFDDGAVAWMGDARPLSGSWLDAAETIDARIRSSKAVFSPWDWMGRDPKHPACIAAYRRRLSPRDFARFERLLRLGE